MRLGLTQLFTAALCMAGLTVAMPVLPPSTLGSLFLITPERYPTDPHEAMRNQREFFNRYGYRGEHLIEALGNGSHHQLHHPNHHNYPPHPV
ncbi:uncharacterized protein LOC143024523 [Oratosquilla oratoria]|uniref:uncharacterized protein LOC143024523 n=1 Tax=Oratosquilla oratoria TaxID=337810 RepID=UPI003F76472D